MQCPLVGGRQVFPLSLLDYENERPDNLQMSAVDISTSTGNY